MNFKNKLITACEKNNSLICVGLDPDINKIPEDFRSQQNSLYLFNKEIIDSTHDLVCAYKPQVAYYSAIGAERDLEMTIDYIHSKYPDIPVVLDAKRGDIGSTAEMYAKEVFVRYKCDAVTVNPYMGTDTVLPFTKNKDKGIIILCKTSNPGSNDFQNIKSEGEFLYMKIVNKALSEWNENENILFVIGATFPYEMQAVRAIAPDIHFLVPGIGAQGGSIKDVVINGQTANGTGLIISSSRSVLYASNNINNLQKSARHEVEILRNEVNKYRKGA